VVVNKDVMLQSKSFQVRCEDLIRGAHTRVWNTRYLAYCYPHGPEEKLKLDEGRMIEFMIWVNERWREFDKMHNRHRDHEDARTDKAHAEFDAWLLQRVGLTEWPNWPAPEDAA
jgi:hypothetical protein